MIVNGYFFIYWRHFDNVISGTESWFIDIFYLIFMTQFLQLTFQKGFVIPKWLFSRLKDDRLKLNKISFLNVKEKIIGTCWARKLSIKISAKFWKFFFIYNFPVWNNRWRYIQQKLCQFPRNFLWYQYLGTNLLNKVGIGSKSFQIPLTLLIFC